MGFTTTTTQQNTAGEQSPEARQAMQQMGTLSQGALDQMGDLSDIASGNFELTPEQLQYLQRAQASAGEMGRVQMEENMQGATRQVEDTAIGRNMTGGSFEAIQQSLLGAQQLRDMNRQSIAQEGQTAQNMVNMPLQYGQAQIQGNQALLNRLVQGAGSTLNYDATMRGLNSSSIGTSTVPMAQVAMQTAGDVGRAAVSGGL